MRVMMHSPLATALLLHCLLASAFAASILDILSWGFSDEVTAIKQRDEPAAENNQRNCACNGPACMCCVDFNFTFIDLGGPGCVQMKYLSQDEGIAVNVSYGENLLHSEVVKGPNPEPACMSMLINLAQVCARFTDLNPTEDGLRGCLFLEPKILDETQTQFNVGCFSMGPDGMKLDALDAGANSTSVAPVTGAEETNEEDLIAAVSESAEQGLAFFSNLLGLNFAKPATNATGTEDAQPENSQAEESSDSARNGRLLAKSIKINTI